MEVPTLAHTAAQIEGHGATITVTYEKKSGNGTSTYSGRVNELVLHADEERISFKREDGHTMYVEGNELYTTNSAYPFVGKVTNIEVDNSTTIEEDYDELSWEERLELM